MQVRYPLEDKISVSRWKRVVAWDEFWVWLAYIFIFRENIWSWRQESISRTVSAIRGQSPTKPEHGPGRIPETWTCVISAINWCFAYLLFAAVLSTHNWAPSASTVDVSIRVKCIGIHWNPSRKLLKMCVGQIKMSRWHGDTLQTAVSKQCPSDSATLPGTFPLLDLGSNISVWVMCTGALPVLYWRSAFNDKTPE